MCVTALLRSDDCLRRPYYTRRIPNHNSHKFSGSSRRKRSPTAFQTSVHDRSKSRVVGKKNNKNPGRLKKSPSSSTSVVAKKNLVMGQVKILKRCEPLPDHNNLLHNCNEKKASPIPTTAFNKLGFQADLVLCSTGRLGPEPGMVRKQIRTLDFYAGSGPIVASPPPSSLPVPAFFSKKEKKIDMATTDLLRLLRLDLTYFGSK